MRPIIAQVIAEARMRLRSTSTIFAILGVFGMSFLYLPDPSTNRVSISWRDSTGTLISGVYDSTYVGAVIGMLSALFLTLIGFYLVAGSIRQDRERHVLEIIAATPVSRLQFITGKWLAHTAYLLIVASTSLAAGLIRLLQYGQGGIEPTQFLIPWILTVPGAMAFTAAFAVLFDVTPILRSRIGWVIWFFAWVFLFIFIPGLVAGRIGPESIPRPAIYDPAGLMAFEDLIETTVPGGDVDQLSMGIMVVDEPVTRVPIGKIGARSLMRPARAWSLVWIATILAASALIFRFKSAPARQLGGPRVEPGGLDPSSPRGQESVAWSPSGTRQRSVAGAVAAETRLTWNAAGLIRWPFLIASLSTLFLPYPIAQGMAAIGLLLLGPIISEVAARESINGTSTLIIPAPSVPRSLVAWKLAAIGLFTFATLLPLLIRAFLHDFQQGAAFLVGMAGTIALATGLGKLTHGGKFFSGLYVVAWYVATQRESALDFTGWFAPDPSLAPSGVWLIVGITTVIPALLLEKRAQDT